MNISEYTTAFGLCSQLALSPTQIVRLIMELVESSGGGRIKSPAGLMAHCRKVIQLGGEAKEKAERTVPFKRAFEETLRAKAHRSALTLRDIRYYMQRLMRKVPGLAGRGVRGISTAECASMLELAFSSPTQRKKARAILSGVFTVARKHDWCAENPVARVDIPIVKEKEILPLKLHECQRLLSTATLPQYSPCAPALGLMLWAGLRPYEVRRLSWKNVDIQEAEVTVSPRHSKTGGGRTVPLCAPLLKLLQSHRPADEDTPICPPDWEKAWKSLRRAAGFTVWTPDVLRHTYASYHAKLHRNLPELQLFMGHKDTALLRERYVNLRGISRKAAENFWLTA